MRTLCDSTTVLINISSIILTGWNYCSNTISQGIVLDKLWTLERCLQKDRNICSAFLLSMYSFRRRRQVLTASLIISSVFCKGVEMKECSTAYCVGKRSVFLFQKTTENWLKCIVCCVVNATPPFSIFQSPKIKYNRTLPSNPFAVCLCLVIRVYLTLRLTTNTLFRLNITAIHSVRELSKCLFWVQYCYICCLRLDWLCFNFFLSA